MKRKTSLASPMIWLIFTVLWVITLCLRIDMDYPYPLLLLSGLCVVLGIVQTVAQWRRYKKDKNSAKDSTENL